MVMFRICLDKQLPVSFNDNNIDFEKGSINTIMQKQKDQNFQRGDINCALDALHCGGKTITAQTHTAEPLCNLRPFGESKVEAADFMDGIYSVLST